MRSKTRVDCCKEKSNAAAFEIAALFSHRDRYRDWYDRRGGDCCCRRDYSYPCYCDRCRRWWR